MKVKEEDQVVDAEIISGPVDGAANTKDSADEIVRLANHTESSGVTQVRNFSGESVQLDNQIETDPIVATGLNGPEVEAQIVDASLFTESLNRAAGLVEVGGPVVWILIAFSVFALGIVFLKLWQFAVLRPESIKEVRLALSLWGDRQYSAAIEAVKSQQPVSGIVRFAMEGVVAEADPEQLRQELSRQAVHLVNQLRSFLRPLEVIASLSPLLGLMGTVLGMILAFQQMEVAGSQVDPAVLSGGIWQALLTTAAGLAVAIPVAAIHSWLDQKILRISHLINDLVTQIVITPAMQQESERAATGIKLRVA